MWLLRTSSKLMRHTSVLIFAFLCSSCGRITDKGKELVDKVENKVRNTSNDLVDKVVPRFDPYNPDTKFNKERFKEFLKVELSPDVKRLYCFDDAVGIDADYMFSFKCDSTTASKIIQKHQLKRDKQTSDYAFGLQDDFTWWDKKRIEKLDLYSWQGEHGYFKYFWYDKTDCKAYYFEFDL